MFEETRREILRKLFYKDTATHPEVVSLETDALSEFLRGRDILAGFESITDAHRKMRNILEEGEKYVDFIEEATEGTNQEEALALSELADKMLDGFILSLALCNEARENHREQEK